MKTIFTLLLSLFVTVAIAQDMVFTHTATAANISADLTTIDHPTLNGNAGALIVATHNLNVGGVQYNNNVSGLYYDGSNWGIYNENINSMIDGASFNVYVAGGGTMSTVQSPGGSYDLEIDNAAVNGNPNAIMAYSTYFNPGSVRNDNNFGFWYNDGTSRWHIYNEATSVDIPANAAFNILLDDGTGGATSFTHDVTAPIGNYTIINHPSLDGKPDAFPVVAHNWGTTGDPWNIVLDATLGVWYNGSNWTIYTEDNSAMPMGVRFNVYVAEPLVGLSENAALDVVTHPNPTRGVVTISATDVIDTVTIFNILGQEVKTVSGISNSITIDISEMATGQYLAKVQAGDSSETVKILKQ